LVIRTGLPSSRISNSPLSRPEIERPSRSVTTISTLTMLTWTVSITIGGAGFC